MSKHEKKVVLYLRKSKFNNISLKGIITQAFNQSNISIHMIPNNITTDIRGEGIRQELNNIESFLSTDKEFQKEDISLKVKISDIDDAFIVNNLVEKNEGNLHKKNRILSHELDKIMERNEVKSNDMKILSEDKETLENISCLFIFFQTHEVIFFTYSMTKKTLTKAIFLHHGNPNYLSIPLLSHKEKLQANIWSVFSFIKTEKHILKVKKSFPNEKFIKKGKNIYVAESRLDGNKQEKDILKKEIEQAQILAGRGHIVHLVPEPHIRNRKSFDAIVDGRDTEFKCVPGSLCKVADSFSKGIEQGTDVFLKVEGPFSKTEIYRAILGRLKILKEQNLLTKKHTNGFVIVYTSKSDIVVWNIRGIINSI